MPPPDDVLGVSDDGTEHTGPPEPRRGFALVGDSGVGKTTALVRYAAAQARLDDVSVLIVDSSGDLPSWFTYSGQDLFDLTDEPKRVSAALQAGVTAAVSTSDRKARVEAINSALEALVANPDAIGRLCVMVDDAHEIIDDVANLVEARTAYPELALTISWQIKDSEPDKYVFGQLGYLMVFRVEDERASQLVADRANAEGLPTWEPRRRNVPAPRPDDEPASKAAEPATAAQPPRNDRPSPG